MKPWTLAAIGGGIVWFAAVNVALGWEPSGGLARQIDFAREVRPILQVHCLSCHGPHDQHANLRLDLREPALLGGESGRKFIGVPAAENELLRRVTDANVEVRMPLEGEPLTEDELETIRLWAEQGAPWDPPAEKVGEQKSAPLPPPIEGAPWYAPIVEALDPLITRGEQVLADYGSLLYAALAFLVLFVVAERVKQSVDPEDPAPGGLAALGRLATAPVWFTGLALLVGWGVVLYSQARDRGEAKLLAGLDSLRKELQEIQGRADGTLRSREYLKVSGSPHVPPRPHHPKRLGGEYYRGNDERSEQLYNGGFYRTATMRIALCGDDRRQLVWGDAVPPGQLYLRLEIERARNASPALFSKSLMAKTFLSRYTPDDKNIADLAEEVVRLETVAPGEKWIAYYPLIAPSPSEQESTLRGQVTIYNGPLTEKQITARSHFGIVYDLHFQSGRILPGSDLWLGSLYYWWSHLEIPTPGKVPLHEWIDFRPLPEIEGTHTSDPKLLGIPEHLPGLPLKK